MMTLLVLAFSGCSTTYIKTPCVYPKIKKIDRPKKKRVTGYKECQALKDGQWVNIGACMDFKNILILKAQNRKLERVIRGYETKLDRYSKKYLDVNQSKRGN
jgi:hypothetical protein